MKAVPSSKTVLPSTGSSENPPGDKELSDLAVSRKSLDARMYKHACQRLGKTPSEQDFEQGYARGEFHFQSDAALLGELIALYEINLHRLGGEWLALGKGTSCYGETPSEAVCRWVVSAFA